MDRLRRGIKTRPIFYKFGPSKLPASISCYNGSFALSLIRIGIKKEPIRKPRNEQKSHSIVMVELVTGSSSPLSLSHWKRLELVRDQLEDRVNFDSFLSQHIVVRQFVT